MSSDHETDAIPKNALISYSKDVNHVLNTNAILNVAQQHMIIK